MHVTYVCSAVQDLGSDHRDSFGQLFFSYKLLILVSSHLLFSFKFLKQLSDDLLNSLAKRVFFDIVKIKYDSAI